ncbi:MAG: hypothetical protein IIA61_02270 [Candidatus Marinimicrobia bacterium]|nr:hypothetical protein [Candidatus Neomarinimicrobiota bacterium]
MRANPNALGEAPQARFSEGSFGHDKNCIRLRRCCLPEEVITATKKADRQGKCLVFEAPHHVILYETSGKDRLQSLQEK